MIRRIEALGFRSLRDVDQRANGFHVLVGPNGSGKSNFLDVVGFLGDVLQAGPLRAVFGDTGRRIPHRAADPQHLCWMRSGSRFELAVELEVPPERAQRGRNGRKYQAARYEVAFDTAAEQGEVGFAGETFWLMERPSEPSEPLQRSMFPEVRPARSSIVRERGQKAPRGWRKVVHKLVDSNDYFRAETTDWNSPFRLGPAKSALANLPEDEERFPVATWAKAFLQEGFERIVLQADAMRRPAPPGLSTGFTPDGSNLPVVIDDLATHHPGRFRDWLAHVQTAIPDLAEVSTVERGDDRHRYLVLRYANGLEAPSWVVSEGTLRLLALTLLAYLPRRGKLYLVEEPENGIHPRGIEAVYESLSSVRGSQVLCASHSTVMLGMARPEELLCFAKDADGATDIVRGDAHPKLRDWRRSTDLGTLFAAGVLG